MPLPFAKMHGLGNTYIYLDLTGGPDPDSLDLPELSRRVSDVHFGIGSDGLIAILPSSAADFRMRMFNADGSEAEMCGNGIRCVGKYVYDSGLTSKTDLVIETGAGLRRLELHPEGGAVRRVRVDMGPPKLSRGEIPMAGDPLSRALEAPLDIDGERFYVTAVSMGNPHCVIFVDEITDRLVREVGPKIERHPAFPRRTNVEFAKVREDGILEMRVWERGSGETMACGTGACAVGVAAALLGRAPGKSTVRLLGGDLDVEWQPGGTVYMTGPAVLVCRGELSDEWLEQSLPGRVENR